MKGEIRYRAMVFGLPAALVALLYFVVVALFPAPDPAGGLASEAGGLVFALGTLLAVALGWRNHNRMTRR